MILYNVTVNIDESVQDEWLEWMVSKHIPDVLATGMFLGNRIFRLEDPASEDGATYSVQYFLRSPEELEKYRKDYAPALQKQHEEKFAGKFVAFRTILSEVDKS